MTDDPSGALGGAVTLAGAAIAGTLAQTMFDLRSHGGGSEDFRIGRQPGSRQAEVRVRMCRHEHDEKQSPGCGDSGDSLGPQPVSRIPPALTSSTFWSYERVPPSASSRTAASRSCRPSLV